MANSQYQRVSYFREGSMPEVDTPKLTPRSSYSTVLTKRSIKEPAFDSKPLILRTVPLLCLLALTLALAGILEYAIVQLPHGSLNLKKRDNEAPNYEPVVERGIVRRADNSSSSVVYYSTAKSAYIQVLSTPAGSTSSASQTVTYYTTAQSAYVQESSTLIFASTDRTAFVDTEGTTTSEAYVTADVADTTAYIGETSTSSSTQEVLQNTAQSAYVSEATSGTVDRHGLIQSSTVPVVAGTTVTAYVPGGTILPGIVPAQDGDSSGAEKGSGDGSDHDDTVEFSANQGASLEGSGDGSKAVTVQVWSEQKAFLATYLAVIVAVLYRLLWIVLWNAFNLIEPFRQLMSREGALAEQAFFAFYQDQSNLLGPIPALTKRRWALALIAMAYLTAGLLPALASESVFVDVDWGCPNKNVDEPNHPCNPRITVSLTVVRIIQGLLGFLALVILSTTSLLLFKKTGLPARPNSIATVASMMRHPRLLADLGEMPVNVSSGEMQRMMSGKRYRLGHYTCANGLAGYGIIPWNEYDGDGFVSPFGTFGHRYTPVDGMPSNPDRSHPRLGHFRMKDFVLALFILGTFGVVVGYHLDSSDSGFNRFLNSSSFGPRFILTLAGTVIASVWKSVEQDAIVMAPYLRLSSRPSSPNSTILLTPSSTPISSTIRTLRHRYFFASVITMLTLAAEALNIVISGVPYGTGQLWTQYIVSAYLSMAVLGGMLVVTALVVILRLREPTMPRKPTTLGAVMSYLCSSRMLDDLEGVECLDQRTRDQRIRQMGKKYEFTETVRRDGKLAWAIDDAFDRPKF